MINDRLRLMLHDMGLRIKVSTGLHRVGPHRGKGIAIVCQ
jgi:hypothetical protein